MTCMNGMTCTQGDLEEDSPWEEGEPRQSKLVFIGKNLDKEKLIAGFDACRDIPENDGRMAELMQKQVDEQQTAMLLQAAQRDDVR